MIPKPSNLPKVEWFDDDIGAPTAWLTDGYVADIVERSGQRFLRVFAAVEDGPGLWKDRATGRNVSHLSFVTELAVPRRAKIKDWSRQRLLGWVVPSIVTSEIEK
jgi:hypothetical protein